ncbi:MAG: hypothetical protein JW924_12390 [Fusobacteriaceae bacterium]|nr:hypothetical protein [Fusobacteriaceae bacterium]
MKKFLLLSVICLTLFGKEKNRITLQNQHNPIIEEITLQNQHNPILK